MGLFSRLKEGLAKTRDTIVNKVKTLIETKTKIDDELLLQLEEILLGADVGIDATERIIDGLRTRAKQDGFKTSNDVFTLLKEELEKIFVSENAQSTLRQNELRVIMIVGVNGVGKTTTIGKLAYNFTQEGKKVLIAAADTFRAAANEQLAIWAERANVNIIQQAQGADPAAVAFDALQSAIAKKKMMFSLLIRREDCIQKQISKKVHNFIFIMDYEKGVYLVFEIELCTFYIV